MKEPFTVVCYGDSNTYGFPAEAVDFARWPVSIRWTGVLRSILGPEYMVVEEGLRGRTTTVDYADPGRAGCNGATYLAPCVRSHEPFDAIVVMLGTNDMKVEFSRTSSEIAEALREYVNVIEARATRLDGSKPSIILVSPPHIDDQKPGFASERGAKYDRMSVLKSRELASYIRNVADQTGVKFLDAATVADSGGDGVHLAKGAHRPLAELVARNIPA